MAEDEDLPLDTVKKLEELRDQALQQRLFGGNGRLTWCLCQLALRRPLGVLGFKYLADIGRTEVGARAALAEIEASGWVVVADPPDATMK